MDNQTPTPDQDPTPGNVPAQNPIIAETPSSQVYTAPHLENPPPPKKPFMFSKILLPIVIIMVLLATTAGTYLALNSKPKLQPVVSKTTPTSTPTPDPTANWKTYTNKDLGFSLKFPTQWTYVGVKANVESVVLAKTDPPGDSPTVVVSVNEINENEYEKISKLKVGLQSEQDTEASNKMFVTRLPDIKVDNLVALVVKQQFEGPPAEKLLDYYNLIVYLKRDSKIYTISFSLGKDSSGISDQILSTLKFTEASPTPTCRPRPACLDATPRCLIPETPDMCRPSITPPPGGGIVCTQEAKLCPDGKTYVGRQGPKCEFAACPGQ